jgi:RNA polymerase sigma-70 factor (ECF subfamily)
VAGSLIAAAPLRRRARRPGGSAQDPTLSSCGAAYCDWDGSAGWDTGVRWSSGFASVLVQSRAQPEVFASLYSELSPSILRFFAHRTRDGQVALDLTAETFAKAFENRARFRGSSSGEAAGWLWTIARNELKMYWRSKNVELAAIRRLGLSRHEASDDELHRIDELVTLEGARGKISEAFDALSPDQQEAIRMHVIDELEYEEIADRLELSNAVVRARVSRGLRRLASSAALENVQGP